MKFLWKVLMVAGALILMPLLAVPVSAQQLWGTQLNTSFVSHPRMISHCDEYGLDSAAGKWHFDAYPRDGRVPVLTFAIRNTGILDNLTDIRITSQCEVGYAIDSLFLYRDNGDSIWNAGDEAIDSFLIEDRGDAAFALDDTVSFGEFFAELPANDTTFFHILLHLDADTIIADRSHFVDSLGLGIMIGDGALHTEHETGGNSAEVENVCYSGGPPKGVAYNVMLWRPKWAEDRELYAWYVSDSVLKADCNAAGVANASGKWHFDAYPRDDKVPVLTFAIRNTGPLDTLTELTITSELQKASAISKLWLYADADGDSIFDETADLLLEIEGAPGTFDSSNTVTFTGLTYELPTNSIKYFHVVVDMKTATIELYSGQFDGKGVGLRIGSGGITLGAASLAEGNSVLVQNPCYPSGTDESAYNAIIRIPNWGDELKAHFVTADDAQSPGCDITGAMNLWHFDVEPTDSASALTFAIRNAGPDDILSSVTVTSENEVPYTVNQLTLFRDNGDSTFGTGDSPLASVDISGAFAADAVARFDSFQEAVPGFDTIFFHVVAWMNSDSILADPATYDSAGVGLKIDVDSIQLAYAHGKSAALANGCPDKPEAFNVVVHTVTVGVPRVLSCSPSRNELNVSPSTNISVTFDTTMDATTIKNSTFVVNASFTGRHQGTISYNGPNKMATFDPLGAFQAGEVVTAVLTTDIKSSDTIPLDNSYAWSFTVVVDDGPGTFRPAVNYTVGDNPENVCAADFDGDGDLDLATGNVNDDSVSVLINNGNGTFATPVNYAVGGYPYAVFAADLNGDGDVDLVSANGASANISVLPNNGDGTFGTHLTYAVGDGPHGVFAADLDGDNDLDVVTANENSDNVSVLINNGTGAFAADTTYPVGDGPLSVFAADLDGDGDFDLAVANQGDDNVSVLLNKGDGTFGTHAVYTVSDIPRSVFAADLDDDGALDLATANENSDNVAVLLNNGNGTFAAYSSYPVGNRPYSVFAADLDGDGALDLATANAGTIDVWTVSVLLNNGDGTYLPQSVYPVGGYPHSVCAADLDGDGDVDLATANSYSDDVSVLLNKLPDGILEPADGNVPAEFVLSQNYPNPFNLGTTIRFTLPEPADVRISVYDILGRKVRQVASGYYSAGTHAVQFDGKDTHDAPLSSGIYFYRVKAGDEIQSRRMVLLK